MPARNRLISSSPAASPPPPIPTGKGSRSAVDPALSEYIDKSIHIPELTLPEHVHSIKPLDIDYQLLISMDDDNDSISRLSTSARGLGIFRIFGHGISSEELRSTLVDSEQIFGLPVKCCTNYGDHEKFVWCDDDKEFIEKGKIVLGEQKFQIFRQNMENVAIKLKAIAEELAKVIAPSAINQSPEQVQLGESTMSIYRYHRANIIDRIPSLVEEKCQESCQYTLKLHLLLESGEFCLQSESHSSSFGASNDTIVVTMGKELEEWRDRELKSAGGELLFRPYLQTNHPSFSIEQKWSSCNLNGIQNDSNKRISVVDQILILLLAIFGLPVKCCTNYGDHEKFVWCDDDKEFIEKGKIVLGEQKYQIFRQNMENVAIKLKAIAEELAKVIAPSAVNQSPEQVQLGESTMSIFRYHRANIIDRIPSLVEEKCQESCQYALKLHLLLESGEFCLQSESHSSSFGASNDTIVVTMGKELEEWRERELNSAGGELLFMPYLQTNHPSFSIEQKWSSCNLNGIQNDSNKRISVADQILILLLAVLLYNTFTFVYS
ncbi:unnamed protein product [Fraxinus pennsylvanica]|uniref:Uncharacterized protein n=1 Tax=Fraxinus pennsylvanica TaxID=56036 RepID=A0AAD1ZER3_9LAMI|nr:unnamed protein product [Fraxinus pennsylvanica]